MTLLLILCNKQFRRDLWTEIHMHTQITLKYTNRHKLFTQNCYVLSTIKQIMKTFYRNNLYFNSNLWENIQLSYFYSNRAIIGRILRFKMQFCDMNKASC